MTRAGIIAMTVVGTMTIATKTNVLTQAVTGAQVKPCHEGYDSSRYHVSDREARRLPNTGRYQQWYKVNGDYVLVNERNNRIHVLSVNSGWCRKTDQTPEHCFRCFSI